MAAVTPPATPIRAAGGLVWRPGPDGQPEVCLVHRQRYDDWSLPKGKLEHGEHPLAAAVREVAEETGVRARPQLSLPPVHYRVDGLPKVVDYWAMSATAVPEFVPNSEVDELAWVPLPAAEQRLRYPHDAALVRHWRQLPPVTAVVLLVRHAHAGDRAAWSGPDHARPLSGPGTTRAAELCRLLELFAPEALLCASPLRCRQTLAPLADATGLPVHASPELDEDAGDPQAATTLLSHCAGHRACTVICTQGGVIPAVLARLTGSGHEAPWVTTKGDGWLVPFAGSAALTPARLAVGPPPAG